MNENEVRRIDTENSRTWENGREKRKYFRTELSSVTSDSTHTDTYRQTDAETRKRNESWSAERPVERRDDL